MNSFSAAWENDLFNGHDYYYTNVIRLSLFHPKIQSSPVHRIFPPFGEKEHRMYHGLHLRQEIYTPRNLEADSVLPGDHPYGATLSLVQSKTVFIPEIGLRYKSEFRIGVLGPAALGLFVQKLAHRISNPSRPPQGWDHQIQNDLILNYNLSLDKQLASFDLSELGLNGGLRLGTLHSDLSGGLWWRYDPGSSFFQRMGPDPSGKFEFQAMIGGLGRYVIYDATLQGGMFNSESPNVISGATISRWLPELNASILFRFKKHELHICEKLYGPRFDRAAWHSWMGIQYACWW
jgi:hypothetical protein